MKHIVKIIAIAQAILFSFFVILYTNINAQAAALPTIGYTMIPVVYETITSMMVAQGVGDANYWNGLDSSSRHEVEEDFKNYMSGYNLTDQQKEYFLWVDRNAHNGLWIKAPLSQGQFRISRTIMDIAANFANENEWLGGGSSEVGEDFTYNANQIYQIGDSLPGQVDNLSYLEWYKEYVFSSTSSRPSFSYLKTHWDYFENFFRGNLLGYNYIHTRYNGGQVVVWASQINSPIVDIKYPQYAYAPNPVAQYWFTATDGNVRGYIYYYDVVNHTFTYGTSDYVAVNQYLINAFADGDYHSTNIGDWTITAGSHVPVGEIGQTNIDNGVVSLPYEQGQYVNIDNYGDTVPLSIPDNIAKDLVIWQGAITDTADVVVQAIEDIKQMDLPITYTQAVAQAGDVAVQREIAITSDIMPNIPSLTVPNFIRRKFPFCIPFDIVEAVGKFSEAGTTAPIIDFPVVFNNVEYSRVHFDFAVFNDLMPIVRLGILIAVVVATMKGTSELIRW